MKNEILKLWILWKVRFSKCEVLDKFCHSVKNRAKYWKKSHFAPLEIWRLFWFCTHHSDNKGILEIWYSAVTVVIYSQFWRGACILLVLGPWKRKRRSSYYLLKSQVVVASQTKLQKKDASSPKYQKGPRFKVASQLHCSRALRFAQRAI